MTKQEYYNKIYDFLIEYGAKEQDREIFLEYMMEPYNFHEFRFMGIFGFGGKLKVDSNSYSLSKGAHERIWVDYYLENRTPKLDEKCKELNRRIEEIEKPVDVIIDDK